MSQKLSAQQRRKFMVAAAAIGAVGLCLPPAGAETWQGGNGNWSDSSKWDTTPPIGGGPSEALIFNAPAGDTTGYTSNNDLTGPFTFNTITFNNAGTGVITLTGNELALGGTTPGFNVSAGTASIGNVISGATLAKTGTGTLILSGQNTYTGTTTVSAGTLVYAANPVTSGTTAFGGFAAGTITTSPVGLGTVSVSAGATFTIDNSNRVMRNTLSLPGTAANPSIVSVPSGVELTTTGTVNGNGVANKTGAGMWRITQGSQTTSSSIATLNINAGTVLLTDPTNGASGGGDLGSSFINVNSGGKFIFGSSPAFTGENPDLPAGTMVVVNTGGSVEWNVGEDFGGIILDGGTFTTRSTTNFQSTTVATELRSGTVTASAGSPAFSGAASGVAAITKTTAGTVTVTGVIIGGAGNSVLNVRQGILSTDAALNGTGNVTFGDATDNTVAGTLQYRGASVTMARPIVLNAGGGTVDVSNSGTTYTLSGGVSGGGNLAKTGAGTLVISGAQTQSGNLTSSGGVLSLTGALTQSGTVTAASGGTVRVNPVGSSGGFAVQSGGTLNVNSGAGTATFTTPTLALAGTGATIRFDLTGTTAPAVPLINVTNTDGLTTGTGNTTLVVNNPNGLVNGATYQLIGYTGNNITSGFVAQLPGRTAGDIVYNTTNQRIDLLITGTASVIWTGAQNANWDVGTAADVGGTNNFKLSTNGNPTNFINTDQVLFDDTSTVTTVNLTAAVQPSSITVNTAGTYTFQTSGGGSIAGTGTLTKQGTGTLILATDNTYSGVTTISAGTLQIGNGGTTGTLGSSNVSIAAGAKLGINRSNNYTYSGVISGTGSIIKDGAGMFDQDSNSSGFTGTLTINSGTFRVSDINNVSTNFNATSIVVNSGGKFEFFGPTGNPNLPESAAGGTVVTVNTGGVAEFTEGELFGGLVLAGGTINTSVGMGVTNGTGTTNPLSRTELRSGSINLIAGGTADINNTGNIRKTTSGVVTLTGVQINVTGTVFIEEGTLSTDSDIGLVTSATPGSLEFGTTTASPTTGTLQFRGTSGTLRKSINVNPIGGTIEVTQANGLLNIAGVTGDATVTPLAISGSGPLTKSGPGALSLGGDNSSYSGNITVTAGKLLVNNTSGSGTGTGNVSVAAGAVLGGSGIITGNLSITGTLSPGNSPGVLTVAGTTTMQPGATYAIDVGKVVDDTTAPVAGTDYDSLVLTGTGTTLTLGNTKLSISESGALKNGQTFLIVDNTGGGTFTGLFANAGGTPLAEGGSVFGNLGGRYTIHYDAVAGDITLTAASVPEPATIGLLSAATGLLLLRRRRKLR